MTTPTASGPSTGMSSSEMNSSEASMNFTNSRAAKKEHDKIVAWARGQYRAIRNARSATERQWYMNLAFYFGKQNVALLRSQTNGVGLGLTSKLYTPPAPYYRVRPVINRIRPTVRHELAQLTNNKPTASIIPASADDRDLYAAMAGEQIWENIYIDNKVKHVIRRAVWWTLVCGNGFMKSYWDFNKGDSGDICFTPETPFHVLCPDFREEEIENQPFLIHAQVKSPEWVKMNFKTAEDGSKLNPPSGEAQDILEESFLNLIGTQALNRQQSVLALEVWVKPGVIPLFPEGAFFTVVGDKIVQSQQGFPYSHKKFPFAKIDHIPGGKFYSSSTIEDLIPLQKEFNRTRGQIIEAKNRMAKPQLIAPRGSIDPSKITTEPGQVILYTPGFEPPRPLPLEGLPAYVLQEVDRILLDWNDISGQHEVSKGGVPPGVTAATAISYLQERDETKMSPTFDSLEEAIEKAAQMSLVYVHDYWDEERLVRMTGPDGSFDVMAFKGSDLGDNLDIRIEAGSSLPVSKAAKQALVMDLMKMNFISPDKGLQVMDMGGINKIYEQIQVDQRQAQRENLRMSKVTPEMIQQHEQEQMQAMQTDPMMAQSQPDPMSLDPSLMSASNNPAQEQQMQQQGQPDPMAQGVPLIVPVNTWDNHKMHIEYHNQYRKGQAFENLDPETKALFEEHVMSHVKAIGAESITLNPRLAAGLPPEVPLGPDGGGAPPSPTDPNQLDKGAPPQPGQQGPQSMPPPQQGMPSPGGP